MLALDQVYVHELLPNPVLYNTSEEKGFDLIWLNSIANPSSEFTHSNGALSNPGH